MIETVKIQGNGYLVNGIMSVPGNAPGNRDYEEVKEWLLTNTPEPEFTEIELLQKTANKINIAIQSHLDSKAQGYRYDNMMSARSYTGYANPFQLEAQALAVWASECWVKAGQIEADVLAGTRPMPTVDEVLAELPIYGV